MRRVQVTRDEYLFGLARRGPYDFATLVAAKVQPLVEVSSRGGPIYGVAIDPTSEVRAVYLRNPDNDRIDPVVEGTPVVRLDGVPLCARDTLILSPLDRTDGRLVLQLAETPAECGDLSKQVADIASVDVSTDIGFGSAAPIAVLVSPPRTRLAKLFVQAHVVVTTQAITLTAVGVSFLEQGSVADPVIDPVAGTSPRYLSSDLGNIAGALSPSGNAQHIETSTPITANAYDALMFSSSASGSGTIRGRFSMGGE